MLDERFKKIIEDNKFIYFNGEKVFKGNLDKNIIDKFIDKFTSKTDFKALSHSLRIAQEVEELLTTGFIKFPLKNAEELREIKNGNANVEDVINKVELTLARVDELLLLDTELPEEADREAMNKILLSLITRNRL